MLGIFIGLVLGLSLAAGVAYYLMRSPSSFAPTTGSRDVREPAREPAKAAKAESQAEKPRFDFYKILPGVEEPKVSAEKRPPDRALAEQARDRVAEKSPAKGAEKPVTTERPQEKAPPGAEKLARAAESGPVAKSAERFWLQAGSFAAEADAENLKARLAFSGWQASVQPGTMPDKAVRYRVRLGPFDNTEELNRVRGDLAKNGFDVAVIKN